MVALADGTIELRAGEIHALVGENGAGKSTLMKLLAGIYTPDAGTFRLNGEELTIEGPRHAQELGISIIHQEFNLMPHLTVAQNIAIGQEPRRGGVFVAEALSVMAQVAWFKYTRKKYGEGRRILLMAPLHHHFEKIGWKETQVVVRFWIITMLLVLFGLSTLKLR